MFEHFLSWPCLYQLNVNDQIKIIHPLFSLLQSCPIHVFFLSQMYKYKLNILVLSQTIEGDLTKIMTEKEIFALWIQLNSSWLYWLLLSDLQLQIPLSQQVMTSSPGKEVRWPQQSVEDDFQSKDGGTLWNIWLKVIYYQCLSARVVVLMRINMSVFCK